MPISFLRGPALGLLCLFYLSLSGQNPTFQKAIGGLSSEIGFTVTELPDGYLIAGATNKGNFTGTYDALLIRTGLDGSILWQKSYGEFAGDDEFRVAKIANDGGFIVFGTTENYGPGNVNAWLLKIDDNGNIVWHKTLGQQDPKTYGSEHLIVLPDGYILSCRRTETLASSARAVVVRVDNDGDVIWSKIPFSDRANYMGFQFVKDGLVYGCGTGSVNFNEQQGIWAALDLETGEVQQAFSYHSQEREDLYSIRPTTDGNLVMSGSSNPPSSGIPAMQAWVQKVQPDGAVIWSKRYDFPQWLQQLPQLEPDNDGGFVLNMHLNYRLTNNDPQLDEKPALMKIDAQGNVLWNRQYSTLEFGFLTSFGRSGDGWIGVGSTYTQGSVTGDVLLLKTDPDGRLESCCTRQQDVVVTDFPNSFVFFPSVPANYSEFSLQNFVSSDEELFDLTAICLDSQAVLLDTLRFCPGESVTIGDSLYDQPGLVLETLPASGNGCDTLVKHVLELLPQPVLNDTLRFCPGESVTIGGTTYDQSATVQLLLPASGAGCDTLANFVLELLPQPLLNDTLRFCPGESVTIGGTTYDQPGIIQATLPASGGGCDTLATYVLELLNENQPNTLSITCPANLMVTAAAGATSANVVYNAPTADSECPCPGLSTTLVSGVASGSAFPLGLSTVCYRADDACGHSASCCFTVDVQNADNPDTPCDVKTAGCITFELVDIKRDAALNWAYRIRVTNHCAAELSYLYIGVPDGITAYSPANNGFYPAPSGRIYLTRNPNYSPMYSVRFKPQDTGISAGQSDVFRYVLPQQADVDYINVGVRLTSGSYVETHLNTFNCPVGTESGNPRPSEERAAAENWRVFPNPVSGNATLNVEGAGPEQPWLELRDLTGKLVFSGQVSERGIALDTGRVPAGMYVYRIFDRASLMGSGKLVVLR